MDFGRFSFLLLAISFGKSINLKEKKMDAQAYYTPESLARKAWAKFKNKDVTRLLEPSAGEGSLLKPWLDKESYYNGKSRAALVDCIEIDITRHPGLRSKGCNVVGVDFMAFNGASIYSHILLNPPFAEGVKHVLKAWEILFDGEMVAIINAETIRNPFSGERKMLVNLIEQHGSVEFLQGEFMTPETERKTPVEIALIHLEKSSNFEMDFLAGLEVDKMTSSGLASNFKEFNEIAMHQGMIENSVTAFNAAVKAAREESFAAARSRYYAGLLGDTMATLQSCDTNKNKAVRTNLDMVRKELQEHYDQLKDRAWTSILRSTQVTDRLSSNAQRRLEKEFENVKQLEFTVANIYGFILGLIDKQSEINMEMMLDVFDSITRHHSENRVYYKGWKSNDRHRTAAYKVKMTRFVMPGHKDDGWRNSPSWDTTRFLADWDKVFAMLDGKTQPDVPLATEFGRCFGELKRGKRISTSYFDVRYYPGIGTIHFFPTDKKLIDRFNRTVGRARQWLPPEGEKVSDNFWLQYEKSEKYSAEVQAEITKANRSRSFWNSVEYDITSKDDARRDCAIAKLDEVIDAVLLKHGIDPAMLIESDQKQAGLLLLAAA